MGPFVDIDHGGELDMDITVKAFRILQAASFAALLVASTALAQQEVIHYGAVSLSSVGMIGVEETVASANFYALPETRSITSEDAFFPPQRIDTCVESEENRLEEPFPAEVQLPFDEGTAVPAGPEISIEADGSAYAILDRSGNTYRQRVAQPLPRNATVDIPGTSDGFPAFADRAFPEPQPVEFTEPVNLQTIDADTTFRWVPSNELAVVMIVMQGAMRGLPSGGIVCFAADDGEFSLAGKAGLSNVSPVCVITHGSHLQKVYRHLGLWPASRILLPTL
jgi:hypothetical protein